jgi:hypothetical protein
LHIQAETLKKRYHGTLEAGRRHPARSVHHSVYVSQTRYQRGLGRLLIDEPDTLSFFNV